ncbi:hypothetical protein ACHAWC_011726 [Mediolabrus comicus]
MAMHLVGAAQRRLPHHLRQATASPSCSSSSSASSRIIQSAIGAQHIISGITTHHRVMSTAPDTADDEAPQQQQQQQLDKKLLATIYNHNRKWYKKAVSSLRKQYYQEIQQQRERESRLRALEEEKIKRAALERRRLKAMRVAANAQKQIEKREARRVEWEKELEITQRERDAKKALYRRAKQKIVDELESEAHLWLTTPDEVEKALGNPTASQILWTRPGGMIGAPSGPDTGFGDDGDFWRYECHTWDARPTYKTPKEAMLEELENMAYLQTNNSPYYWTKERVEAEERKEQRARLRAIVREEGRRALLEKQRQMMRDVYGGEAAAKYDPQKGGKLPPTTMPAPKLDYLADYEAQERAGAEILRKDPTKFFIFESDLPNVKNRLQGSGDESESGSSDDAASSGASLGRPVALKNPFFNYQPTAFPLRMGRDLPADTRTEKEKKRDERQERLKAAAEEAALAASKGMSYEVAMAAEEDLEDGSEDVDYDLAEDDAEKEMWESQMEEWKDRDRRVFDMTPPSQRVTSEEVDWIIEQLQTKVKGMQERLEFEEKIRQKELESSEHKVATSIESMDDVDRYVMQDLGYDMEALEQLVQELTPEQAAALEELDFTGRADITAEVMAAEINSVAGLTEVQVQTLVGFEMSLLNNDALKSITKMD